MTGGLSPLPRESCSPESEACFCSPFFFQMRSTSTATRSSHTLHLARDVMAAARVPRPSWTAPSGRDSPSCRIPTTRAAMTSPCTLKANLALRGVPHASTCALPVRNLCLALCEQNTLRRPRRVSHTCPPGEPIQSESITSLPFVRRGIGNIHRVRFRTGFHSRKRARGGLVRCTARTSRSPPCKPGTLPKIATAATRPLSFV